MSDTNDFAYRTLVGVREGLAERIIVEVDGRTAAVQVPSLVPSRKRGAVQLLRRTSPVQPEPVNAPGTLFEAWSA